MDFRNNRPTVPPASPAPENLGDTRPTAPKGPKRRRDGTKFVKAFYISFLIAIAILLLAMVLSIAFAKNNDYKEKKYVNNDQLQAVFLNGGQVYFGHISDLNSKYLTLNNVYYLRVNQQVQPEQQNAQQPGPNDISLVKLGCELHGPEDTMVINREQTIFWENLKTDGQVTKAVEAYVKANPEGQKCQDNSQQGSNNGSSGSNNNQSSQNNNQSNNNQQNNSSSGSNNGNEASISTP